MEKDSLDGFDDEFGKNENTANDENVLDLKPQRNIPKFTEIVTEDEIYLANLEKKLDKVRHKPKTVTIVENLEEIDDVENNGPLIENPNDFFDLNPPISNIGKGMVERDYLNEENITKEESSDEFINHGNGWWRWMMRILKCEKEEIDYDSF
jgi:hypothetical protein